MLVNKQCGIIAVLAVAIYLIPMWISAAKPYSEADFAEGKAILEEMKGAGRTPALEKPRAFVRSQTKYSGRLFQSRYEFDDRPLFNNRRIGGGDLSRRNLESYKKSMELYRLSGLDGYATFAWPGIHEYNGTMMPIYNAAKELNLDSKEFNIFFEVSTDPSYMKIDQIKLEEMLRNPYTFRFNGKIVISSYCIDSLPPEKLKEYIDNLQKCTNNQVAFLPQMHFLSLKDANGRLINGEFLGQLYYKHHTLPKSLIVEMQKYLRQYLEFCDGLYIGSFNTDNYTNLDSDFLNKVIVPIYKSVLAEKKYDGKKLFAIQGKVGYTAYYGAQSLSRNGTQTLRDFLHIWKNSGADLFIGTEWDELNEDTGFQPLVSKPMSTQRILSFFMKEMKNEAPIPLPGDDTSTPNLIISQRHQIVYGTKLHIELLNVPDGVKNTPYAVELKLKDENGEIVWKTPEALKFDSAKMTAHNIRLASEDFKACRTLRPELTITGYNDLNTVVNKGLPFTILRTATADMQYYCTPLRNVLLPESDKINFDSDRVEFLFKGKENIATAEMLQDNIELCAYDPRNEFLQNDSDRILFRIKKLALCPTPRLLANLKYKVTGAPSLKIFNRFGQTKSNVDFSQLAGERTDFEPYNNEPCDWWDVPQYFSIKKSEIPKAMFSAKGVRNNGKHRREEFEWEFPLVEVGEKGINSKFFEDGLMFAVEADARPAVQPLPYDTKEIEFIAQVKFDNPDGVACARVVSENGKVFYSEPFVLCRKESGRKQTVKVYSETANKHIPLELAEERVPVLNYDLSDKTGGILRCSGAREYFGVLGGALPVATNFQGVESNLTMNGVLFSQAPSGADKAFPERIFKDGAWLLKFDGVRGSYIGFSNTMLPQRAGFTITMEILPEQIKEKQILFSNGIVGAGSLSALIVAGKINLHWLCRTPANMELPAYSVNEIDTGLILKNDKFQKLTFVYDGEKIFVSNNGKQFSYPMHGIGIYNQYTAFGGPSAQLNRNGQNPYFTGLLKSFEVKHYPDTNALK